MSYMSCFCSSILLSTYVKNSSYHVHCLCDACEEQEAIPFLRQVDRVANRDLKLRHFFYPDDYLETLRWFRF
uniref:Uncharacterized protein n=1 Tax=Rhizophora mucronata TaxID=61149 RepID=A0A2P2QNG3_RHIMU